MKFILCSLWHGFCIIVGSRFSFFFFKFLFFVDSILRNYWLTKTHEGFQLLNPKKKKKKTKKKKTGEKKLCTTIYNNCYTAFGVDSGYYVTYPGLATPPPFKKKKKNCSWLRSVFHLYNADNKICFFLIKSGEVNVC